MQTALIANNEHFHVTPIGLIIEGEPSMSEVDEALKISWKLLEASKWAQIDLLCYARDHFGDDFSFMIDMYHYAPGTIGNMLWMGENIPFHARVEGVSLSHHQVVAPPRFTIEEKTRWLERAKEARWSRDELRAAVMGLLPEEFESGPPIPVNFESATRMMIDWLDGKINYSKEELKEVLMEFLRRME